MESKASLINLTNNAFTGEGSIDPIGIDRMSHKSHSFAEFIQSHKKNISL